MLADANLIWANCRLYNAENSPIYDASEKLEAAFLKAWEAAGLPNVPPDATRPPKPLPDSHPVKDAPTSRRTPRAPREVDDVTSGPEGSSVVQAPEPQAKRKRDSAPVPEVLQPSGQAVKRRRTATGTPPEDPSPPVAKPAGKGAEGGGTRGRGRGKDVEEQPETTPDVVTKRGNRRGSKVQEESPSDVLPPRGTPQEPEKRSQEPEKRSSRRQSSRTGEGEGEVEPARTAAKGRKEKLVVKTAGRRRG